MQFQPQLETRCLGQITRNPVKPEIIDRRGDCKTCLPDYLASNFKNFIPNKKCKAYTPIVVRIFEVE